MLIGMLHDDASETAFINFTLGYCLPFFNVISFNFQFCLFIQPESLYNDGMRPVVYSEKDAALHKIGWVRGGHDIKYYKNNLRY